MIYRISGDALLQLATMAARGPGADVDTVLAIVRGADPEPQDAPVDAEHEPYKPAKPE